MIDIQVLIVGAGPTGLVLALDLARRGISFRIIDKAPAHFSGSRGKGLTGRSQEVFDDLGVLADMLKVGAGKFNARFYDRDQVVKEIVAPPVVPVPGFPYANSLLIRQWQVESILRDHLTQSGVEVEMDTALIDYHQAGGMVSASVLQHGENVQIRANYLIGCDGGHSQVRKLMGTPFEGRTEEDEPRILGDVEIRGLSKDFMHLWFREGKLVMAITPFPGSDAWQFIGPAIRLDGELLEPSAASFQTIFNDYSGMTNVQISNATWLSALQQTNIRIAKAYRDGCVFLAGDAAHVHSASGGQGLNTGVQDAYNLSWKLEYVLKGIAGQRLLDSYQEERRPVAEDVLGLSSAYFHEMRSSNSMETIEKIGATHAASSSATYRESALSVDLRQAADAGGIAGERRSADAGGTTDAGRIAGAGGIAAERRSADAGQAGHILMAGDRAPDAVCHEVATDGEVRLFDLFRGPHFTLLLFGEPNAGISGWFQRNPVFMIKAINIIKPAGWVTIEYIGRAGSEYRTLSDTHGEAFGNYDITKSTLVLVRPDGYIGLIAQPYSVAEIDGYFHGVICR